MPWAIDMSNINFPGRTKSAGQWMDGRPPLQNLGAWFWESGFGKHTIDDMEWVRDYNLRAMYGVGIHSRTSTNSTRTIASSGPLL